MKKLISFLTVIAIVFGIMCASFPVHGASVYEYYYDQLSTNEKTMYKKILSGLNGSESSVSLEALSGIQMSYPYTIIGDTTEEMEAELQSFVDGLDAPTQLNNILSAALDAVWLDHPEVPWIIKDEQYTVTLGLGAELSGDENGTFITLQTELHFGQLDTNGKGAAIKSKIASIGATGTSLQKLKTIHDFICKTTKYSHSGDYGSVYGALVEGNAVCQGYTQAFKMACDYYGVQCVTVTGDGDGDSGWEQHAWNYVYLDGAWYAVDTTWDDADNSKIAYYDYFVVGGDTQVYKTQTYNEIHRNNGKQNTTSAKTFAYPSLSSSAYDVSSVLESTTGTDGGRNSGASHRGGGAADDDDAADDSTGTGDTSDVDAEATDGADSTATASPADGNGDVGTDTSTSAPEAEAKDGNEADEAPDSTKDGGAVGLIIGLCAGGIVLIGIIVFIILLKAGKLPFAKKNGADVPSGDNAE